MRDARAHVGRARAQESCLDCTGIPGGRQVHSADQELTALFTPYGQVDSVRLIRDRATGQSRGFGFVEMADASAGRAACTALDQQEFEGRRLTVNEAKPQEQRSGGGGGGFGQRRDARW